MLSSAPLLLHWCPREVRAYRPALDSGRRKEWRGMLCPKSGWRIWNGLPKESNVGEWRRSLVGRWKCVFQWFSRRQRGMRCTSSGCMGAWRRWHWVVTWSCICCVRKCMRSGSGAAVAKRPFDIAGKEFLSPWTECDERKWRKKERERRVLLSWVDSFGSCRIWWQFDYCDVGMKTFPHVVQSLCCVYSFRRIERGLCPFERNLRLRLCQWVDVFLSIRMEGVVKLF